MYICIYILRVCTHTYIHIYTYMHMCVYTYIYIYIYRYTYRYPSLLGKAFSWPDPRCSGLEKTPLLV